MSENRPETSISQINIVFHKNVIGHGMPVSPLANVVAEALYSFEDEE